MNFLVKLVVNCFTIFYPIKIYGKENIPSGKALFICNHFRAIDCGYVAKAYKKDIKFLAKKELFKNKLTSKVLNFAGAIPVDRDNPELKTMLSVIKYLKEGHKVCVFPEGTRNKSGTTNLQDTKAGYVVFATSTSCPIVPIMLSGKGRFLKRQKMIIGKPIEFTEFYGKKLDKEKIEELNKIVRENLEKIQSSMSDIKAKNGNN